MSSVKGFPCAPLVGPEGEQVIEVDGAGRGQFGHLLSDQESHATEVG